MTGFDKEDLGEVADALRSVANAITDQGTFGGTDASGGHVRCLTEAVMGVTAGLVQIAEAIENLADVMATSRSIPF